MASEAPRPTTLGARCRRACTLLLTLLLVALGAPPAAAQPSATDKATARTLMDSGRTKERQGDYEGALEAYIAADKIMGVPTTGLSVGQMQVRLGKLAEAVDTLLRVARQAPAPGEPHPFTAARNEAQQLADSLTGRIPSVQIELEGVPPDTPVKILVNGTEVEREAADLPRKVNPGRLVVVVSAPGYLEIREEVDLAEGEQRVVRLRLEPAPDAADSGTEQGSGELSPLVWVGFGVGAAGIVIGAITGGLAAAKSSELDEACVNKVCPPEREGDLDSLMALAHTSTVSFVLGGLGVGLGLVALFVLSDPSTDDTGSAPTARLTAGPGSLLVTGTF